MPRKRAKRHAIEVPSNDYQPTVAEMKETIELEAHRP